MQHRKFTLVELLVALGVFSILLILFMQLFSGMRLAWTNTEKRNDSYGDVRAAVDMMSSLVATVYYSPNNTFNVPGEADETGHFPFKVKRRDNAPDSIYLATNTLYDLPGTNNIRFISFLVANKAKDNIAEDTNHSNELYMTCFTNQDSQYFRFFPNFLKEKDGKYEEVLPSKALEELVELLNGKIRNSDSRLKLLDNVVDFKIKCFDEKGGVIKDTEVKCVPCEIEFIVAVMKKEDLDKWNTLVGNAKTEFQLKNQMVVSRRIFIGERMTLEVKDE